MILGWEVHKHHGPILDLFLLNASPLTGIPTIDYFISSDVEIPSADKHYSERLYRISDLGAYFFRPAPTDVKRNVLRQRIQAELNLPSNVHFYLCPQALFKFHPSFDDVLVEILSKDKLGYLFLLNGGDRQAWSKLLLSRMQAKMKVMTSSRHTPGSFT